jgi:hypothetical protein
MSACGGPAHSSETSKNKSSSSQGNDHSSSNSDSTPNSSSNGNNNSSSHSDLTNSFSSKKITPTFNQTVVDRINPGWQLEKSQIIHFPDHDVIVAVIAKPPYMSEPKLIVVQVDSVSGSWLTKWSGNVTPNGFGKLQSFLVTQPNPERSALAIVSEDQVASPLGAVAMVLKIDESGTCILEETFYSLDFSIEQQGNAVIVNADRKVGMRTLSLHGKNYVDHRTPASQLSPPGSVQVAFQLDHDGNVVPAKQKTLTMKVGQTIAFIPADERTKEEFDQGDIWIYFDWGKGNIDTSTVVNSVWSGNSYTFDKKGTVRFLLITNKKWSDIHLSNTKTMPTFIIDVEP